MKPKTHVLLTEISGQYLAFFHFQLRMDYFYECLKFLLWPGLPGTSKTLYMVSLWLKHFFKKKINSFIFRERRREGEREGEKHQCVVASHIPPTGDLACNAGICPDWESNWRPFGLQTGTQFMEPHQPGLIETFLTPHFTWLISILLPPPHCQACVLHRKAFIVFVRRVRCYSFVVPWSAVIP